MIDEIKKVLEKYKDHIPVVVMAEILAIIDEAEEHKAEDPENGVQI